MFQNTSRIENIKGLRFYEQDILYDDYTYSEDIELVIDAQYLSPGFGIILLNNEGLTISEQKEMFLFRVGYHEASIIYKYEFEQNTIKQNNISLVPPKDNIKFIFTKIGKKITLTTEDAVTPLLEYAFTNDNWDKFSLGIYSNAGNVINNINIQAPIPYGWNLNMHNTDGGYVKFNKSSFSWFNCEYDAELEQENIILKPGRYYLKYDSSNDSDIKAYIYQYKDEGLFVRKKNILKDNLYFDLDIESAVSLKFIGRQGTISNIHICERLNDPYMPTKDNNSFIKGSSIILDMNNLDYASWEGLITDIPVITNDLTETPFIISNGKQSYLDKDIKVSLNIEYKYTFYYDGFYLLVQTMNGETISTITFNEQTDYVTLFYNIDAQIKNLKIKLKTSDNAFDYSDENANIKYVSKDITSPIIVVDNENTPLDLSSSYRFLDINSNNQIVRKYIFTNIEREIFEPTGIFYLEKPVVEDISQIRIYGVLKDVEINEDYLLGNKAEDIYTEEELKTKIYKDYDNKILNQSYFNGDLERETFAIDSYCQGIEDITESIVDINYTTGRIVIDDVSKYQQIIIDYKKKDSYCINYLYSLALYKVEISSINNYSLIHDKVENNNNLYEREDYKPLLNNDNTPLRPINGNYIILRKE